MLGFTLAGCHPNGQRHPVSVMMTPGAAGAPKGPFDVFLRIAPDGKITVIVPASEMGQGSHTALAQILADEMDADWANISVEQAGGGVVYRNPLLGRVATGNSTSIRAWWMPLRKVGATARAMLASAAAARWGVPVSEVKAASGKLTYQDRILAFGEVATEASTQAVPDDPRLKEASQFTLIGKSAPRLEAASKVDGSARFGIDTQILDMIYAAVVNAPVFDSDKQHAKTEAVLKSPGVIAVVPVTGGLAVVADTYWHATQGLRALAATFSGGTSVDTKQIQRELEKALEKSGQAVTTRGGGEKALKGCKKLLEATYHCPFLDQAPLEPMNCTAHVTPEFCRVWVPTQAQDASAGAAAQASGHPEDKVEIHTTLLGGSFGRRFETDLVTQAVEVAKKVGKPVKLIWSREESMQHGFYRPMSVSRFRVGLDAQGFPVAWTNRLAGPSVLARALPTALIKEGDDTALTEGARDPGYALPNFAFAYCRVDTPVPVGFFRGVAHSHNAFYVESMIDEIAHAGGHSPLELRKHLLKGQARQLRVLDLVATKAKWTGRNQGLAIHRSCGTVVAYVVELSVHASKVKIHRVTAAVDCGTVVNANLVEAQIEGGVVFALTAAFKGKITVTGGKIDQSNFDDYPLVTMRESPPVDVFIVPSSDAPGGMEEPPVGPLAPAVANALFAATGRRIRSLPFKDAGFELA